MRHQLHQQQKSAVHNGLEQAPERLDRRMFLLRGTTLVAASILSGCGGGGTSSSNGAQQQVVTPPPPVILTHPKSQSLPPGQSATFQVEATGESPLAYQWLRGGIDIPGATSQSYTTPPVNYADDGAIFSVLISGPSGSVISTTVQLTIILSVIFVDSKTITIDSTQITTDTGQS